jgi:hypothetical protein
MCSSGAVVPGPRSRLLEGPARCASHAPGGGEATTEENGQRQNGPDGLGPALRGANGDLSFEDAPAICASPPGNPSGEGLSMHHVGEARTPHPRLRARPEVARLRRLARRRTIEDQLECSVGRRREIKNGLMARGTDGC